MTYNKSMYAIRDSMLEAINEPSDMDEMKRYIYEALEVLEQEYLGEKALVPIHPGQMKML